MAVRVLAAVLVAAACLCLVVPLLEVARAQEAPWYLQAALDHHRVDMCGLAPQTAATRVRVVLCAWRVVPLLLAAPAQSRCHRAHLRVAAAAVCRLALVRVRVAQAVRCRCLLAVCLAQAVSAVQCHWRPVAVVLAAAI